MEATQLVLALAIAASGLGQAPSAEETKTQNEIFARWWETELNWNFDELPGKGSVPHSRVPYSGHIWPDSAGGVVGPLQKYDRAFHGGRTLATSHELWDANSGRETPHQVRRFGWRGNRVSRGAVSHVPYWHGHCNGWAAAAIRHPEPQFSVTRNGVTFSPSDIKGLLAEVYVYSQYESLAGEYNLVDPAFLHVLMTNWIGNQRYPIAMEATPGKERWNYPIYAYATTSAKRNAREAEVKMNIAYAYYSNGEWDRSQHDKRTMYFHYMLNLDAKGKIVSGYYFYDSSRIDLLWAPLAVLPGGTDGNERGNPYINVNEIISIARDSVPDDLIAKWPNPVPTPVSSDPPADEALADVATASGDDAATEAEASGNDEETTADAPAVAATGAD
jgi:hypothetical protein